MEFNPIANQLHDYVENNVPEPLRNDTKLIDIQKALIYIAAQQNPPLIISNGFLENAKLNFYNMLLQQHINSDIMENLHPTSYKFSRVATPEQLLEYGNAIEAMAILFNQLRLHVFSVSIASSWREEYVDYFTRVFEILQTRQIYTNTFDLQTVGDRFEENTQDAAPFNFIIEYMMFATENHRLVPLFRIISDTASLLDAACQAHMLNVDTLDVLSNVLIELIISLSTRKEIVHQIDPALQFLEFLPVDKLVLSPFTPSFPHGVVYRRLFAMPHLKTIKLIQMHSRYRPVEELFSALLLPTCQVTKLFIRDASVSNPMLHAKMWEPLRRSPCLDILKLACVHSTNGKLLINALIAPPSTIQAVFLRYYTSLDFNALVGDHHLLYIGAAKPVPVSDVIDYIAKKYNISTMPFFAQLVKNHNAYVTSTLSSTIFPYLLQCNLDDTSRVLSMRNNEKHIIDTSYTNWCSHSQYTAFISYLNSEHYSTFHAFPGFLFLPKVYWFHSFLFRLLYPSAFIKYLSFYNSAASSSAASSSAISTGSSQLTALTTHTKRQRIETFIMPPLIKC